VRTKNTTRSPIRLFVMLAFGLSWPILLYGFGWFGYGPNEILKRFLLSCLGMLMVAVAAFIVRFFAEGKNFGDVGWNLGHPKWYLGVLLFCASLWVIPLLVAHLFGQLEWKQTIDMEAWTVMALSLAGPSVIAGFGEEFGWRGYLLPRLLSRRSQTREILVFIGIIWGIWHFPVALGPLLKGLLENPSHWGPMVRKTLLNCVQMIGACMALSFIFGAMWLRTRSIFVLSFFHGYFIGIRDATTMILAERSAMSTTITAALLVVAVLIAYHWLERYKRDGA
jgi:membrane protease YdiL (CAAX protease family)